MDLEVAYFQTNPYIPAMKWWDLNGLNAYSNPQKYETMFPGWCIYIYIWGNYNDLTATEPWNYG